MCLDMSTPAPKSSSSLSLSDAKPSLLDKDTKLDELVKRITRLEEVRGKGVGESKAKRGR